MGKQKSLQRNRSVAATIACMSMRYRSGPWFSVAHGQAMRLQLAAYFTHIRQVKIVVSFTFTFQRWIVVWSRFYHFITSFLYWWWNFKNPISVSMALKIYHYIWIRPILVIAKNSVGVFFMNYWFFASAQWLLSIKIKIRKLEQKFRNISVDERVFRVLSELNPF